MDPTSWDKNIGKIAQNSSEATGNIIYSCYVIFYSKINTSLDLRLLIISPFLRNYPHSSNVLSQLT